MISRFALLVLLLAAGPALAQQTPLPGLEEQAMQRWQESDACVATATARYPDQTLDSLRHRDSLVDACLEAHQLPPLSHLAQ